MKKILITDLDNTLYDWVTYYSNSFRSMISKLAMLIDIDEALLLSEFKLVHQKYQNTEQPFAILELPSVLSYFKGATIEEVVRGLEFPLTAFNRTRDTHLRLYPGVSETLAQLHSEGIRIIGYTDASAINSYFRLKALNVLSSFDKLYASEGMPSLYSPPSDIELLSENFIIKLPNERKKPNATMLLDICEKESTDIKDVWYLGDSLQKDIAMANEAGIQSIWARYGTIYDKTLWDILLSITHWTDKEIEREVEIANIYKNITPTYAIDNFSDITKYIKNA